MPVLTQPAFGPRVALAYVTGGALMCVWTLVWYFTRDHDLSRTQWFWVAGFLLTGLTFVVLGLILGPLGRAARQAELPPREVVQAEAAIQHAAAMNQAAVAAPAAPAPAAGVAAPAAPAAVPTVPPPMTVVPATGTR